MSEQKDAMITLGGLWENTTAAGDPYFSGSFGRARIFIFRNKNASGSQPQWVMKLAAGAPPLPQGASSRDQEVPF